MQKWIRHITARCRPEAIQRSKTIESTLFAKLTIFSDEYCLQSSDIVGDDLIYDRVSAARYDLPDPVGPNSKRGWAGKKLCILRCQHYVIN
jgi:hypothetical protein